jgi:tripartite-type tricarboxylate transporter receptor subunit TctC
MTKFARSSFLLLAALLFAQLASAQTWPTKPVKIVVPFTAGSATDILARTAGQKLQDMWGQPVVIDNRPGAGGTIGTGIVAKSPPDGYTLLVNSAAQAYNPAIYPNLPFDTVKDFIDVGAVAGQPNVLVVAPATGYKTTADLIAAAKQKPGELNYGSAGIGSGTHLNAEKFRLASGISAVHVPYKGTPEALTDTMTGRVTYFFSPISAALPNIREGKLVALAVSTGKRSSVLPNVRRSPNRGCPASTTTCGSGCSRRRDARRHRRQDREGPGQGHAIARRQGAARRNGRRSDADVAKGLHQVRQRRNRRRSEGRQGCRHQGAVTLLGAAQRLRSE